MNLVFVGLDFTQFILFRTGYYKNGNYSLIV
jgi:hypothetical protein